MATVFFACEDESSFPETRLFRPVLSTDLEAVGNTIIVNMGNMKRAVSYTLEVSRDSFETTDYVIETDTNYLVLNEELLNGDPLFWNTLYQLRATAHAAQAEYDSKVSDLGNVRTERFPSILNLPESYDVIDVAVRVSWTVAGAAVTGIKVFASNDLKLTMPLAEHEVSSDDQADGDMIVTGLDPETAYQLAIYSEGELRGWADYTTLDPDIDPTAAGVIDIREDTDPQAVANAVAAAPEGAIILVKRGVFYDLPSVALERSVTIRAAYGFGEQKAGLYTTGNWDIADGANIDHIRFIDLELRGEDYSGDYVLNPNRDNVYIGELLFENCEIGTFRGIIRIRKTVELDHYRIINCVVDSLGGYGLITTDTSPSDPTTAHVNHVELRGSTFNKLYMGISSKNNSQSIAIDGCTFANFINVSGSYYMFRYQGGEGNNNVTGGITITNSIFGHGWDEGASEILTVRGVDGLGSTSISVVNCYTTADFGFASAEIATFPPNNYSGTQEQLWVDPAHNDFNFKDTGFAGRFDTGDPRWRIKL